MQEWYVGFLARAIYLWLSYMIIVAPSCKKLTSLNIFKGQITSFVHKIVAIYSTFIVDKAILDCLLWLYEIMPTPTKNTYSMVDWYLFASLIQSILQNPLKVTFVCVKHNLKCKVSFKYCMMCSLAIQYNGPIFNMNWLIILIKNIRFTYVPI